MCEFCPATFKLRDTLRKHLAKHSGQTFSCNILNCTKIYPSLVQLNRHKKLSHGPRQNCNNCPRTFSNNVGLNRHFKLVHHDIFNVSNVPTDMEAIVSEEFVVLNYDQF